MDCVELPCSTLSLSCTCHLRQLAGLGVEDSCLLACVRDESEALLLTNVEIPPPLPLP